MFITAMKIGRTLKNGKSKHWVKAYDSHDKVVDMFGHKEHVGIDLMDLANENVEMKNHFNEFAHDAIEATMMGHNVFEKDVLGDEDEAVKWNVLHVKKMKKWNVKSENHEGKDLEDQSGGSHCLNSQERKIE